MTRPQRLRSELRISSKLLLMMAPKSYWWLSSLLSTKAKHWIGIMLLEMRLQNAANIFCFSFITLTMLTKEEEKVAQSVEGLHCRLAARLDYFSTHFHQKSYSLLQLCRAL